MTGLNDTSGDTKTTFNPWGPQGEALKGMFGDASKLYDQNTKQGYQGLDPASIQALQQMQNMANAPNGLVAGATGAVKGVESGANSIGTGGMFNNIYQNQGIDTNHFDALYRNPQVDTNHFDALYNNPGINNAPQYQSLFEHPGINNAPQYQALFDNQPTANYFGQSYQQAQQPGALDQGIYGNIAKGGLLSAYPTFQPQYDQNGVPQSSPGMSAQSGIAGSGGDNGTSDPRLNGIPRPAVDPNPYRSQALQDALTQAANHTKAGLSSAGRYGSSAYGDAMGRALGQAATSFNLNAYEGDMNRMMQAAQAQDQSDIAHQGLGLQSAQGIANVQEQNHANKLAAAQGISGIEAQNAGMKMNAAQALSGVEGQNAQMKLNAAQGLAGAQGANAQQLMQAAQGVAGVQGQNVQNQLSAAQGLTGVQGQNINNQLQAAGMAPAMQNLRYDDLQRLAQVGAARQQNAQAEQNFGWDQLNAQKSIVGNVPGTAGTGTSTPPQQSWWQTLLGAGATGAGIFGSLFG